MSKVIMTSVQLVERLKKLASRNTFYKNVYPYNLCYVHSNGQTSADCVNLYKALLNGLDVNNLSAGYFQQDLSNTGDVTEWGLMQQCSDVSQNFTKLKAGEPRLLYMSGHIGGYIGEEVVANNHVYNVIECTGAWGGGILYSYVDSAGRRFNHKNGVQNGSWTHHGKMTPWVSYVTPQPTPAPSGKTNVQIAQEVIDGKWGNQPERQKKLEAAGYNYRTIQDLVNKMLSKKSVTEVAKEVIDGKWGNYPERKTLLEKAGYNYREVQNKVNEMLR